MAACTTSPDKGCAGVDIAAVTPGDTTIAVGQSFVAHYEEGGACDPAHITAADYHEVPIHTWQSSDTLVATVDSATGLVTGRAAGDAQITGAPIPISVHVR